MFVSDIGLTIIVMTSLSYGRTGTDVVYRRPEDKEDTETVIDLSKPEVQDAEIVDEED